MWGRNWRDAVWERIGGEWDLIVVGGGITGAGILREATRAGLRTLLVEQRDFAWGTSSRSSKLVHGGLRYLAQFNVGLTWASVREREQLLEDAPGLVTPLGFLYVRRAGDKTGRLMTGAGLTVYDLMGRQRSHKHYGAEDFRMLAPRIAGEWLKGGYRFEDAQTDDARLVLRVIREAVAAGGTAINYTAAEEIVRDEAGRACGVRLRDAAGAREAVARAQVIVSATGVWAEKLRGEVEGAEHLRPLRGSHLVFPAWRFPVAQALTFPHPADGRYMFIFPWEGATVVGTTDLDHSGDLNTEPRISPEEVAYLMAAVDDQFPSLHLTLDDVVSTFAGVRPVIGTGKEDPSKESRDHVVWHDDGLITVTGGKLTTFRLIALDVLKAAKEMLPEMPDVDTHMRALDDVQIELPEIADLGEDLQGRLIGRYGADARTLIEAAEPGELEFIPNTPYLWAEVRWAARDEGVVHLQDLLLRRVRLGLLAPEGGAEHLARIRAICQPELGWDDARWEAEEADYLQVWRTHYSLPERERIPDWHTMLGEGRAVRVARIERGKRRVKRIRRGMAISGFAILLAAVWRRRKHVSDRSSSA